MKKYIFSTLTAFAISYMLCLLLIPLLRRLKAGQNILSYVKEHKQKSGTPTMGGIAFVFAAVLSAILFVRRYDKTFVVSIVIGLGYMIVGLIDDFLKRKHKENLGLTSWQKFLFQTLIAVLAGIYCLRMRLTNFHVPFFNMTWELGGWAFPLVVFVFIGTVNAVNLTDGLDGLAAGVSAPYFLSIGILLLIQSSEGSMAILSFCLTGALAAYLLFNVFPASVFMGDTGSLALGGFAASISVFTGNLFYLAIVGVCFVFSVISVLIQVIYYKATGGKRVFLMTPVHHHFQEKGFSESRIAYAYFIITAILGAICIATASS